MGSIRQTSFAAGELSPYLHGRTDLEEFGHGARKLLNFFISKQGSAISRPGTRKGWTSAAAAVSLVPFLHPSGESYVLELSHLKVRIYNARTLAFLLELVTPFQSADLTRIQWAQNGSTLSITHPSRPAQEIIAVGATFTIQPMRFGPPGDSLADAPMEAKFPSIGGNPPAVPVLVAWQPGTLFVVDAAHPPREWKYKVSSILRNNVTGELIETLAVDIVSYSQGDASTGTVSAGPILPLPADNLLILYSDAPIYIAPGLGAVIAAPANWTVVEYVYYRGRGSLFGLVGSTKSNDLFADFGDEPNYTVPPLRGESPFRAGEYPAAVAFFQQRRSLAGPAARPATWWASAVDEYANNDKPVLNWSGQPLEATLLNRKRERIVSMGVLEHLFVLTDTSVWQLGRNDVPLDYDTLPSVTRVIDEVGALPLQPLVVGDALLYAVAQGRGVRCLRQTNAAGNFQPDDASWHAEHLFRGRNARIISWCYQRQPWGVVWAVRDDGVLLSCTRTGASSWAWAKHETDGDTVLSVAAMPQSDSTAVKGDFDMVFLAVLRNGVVVIERLVPHTVDDPALFADDPDYAGNTIGFEQLSYPLDSYVVVDVDESIDTVVAGLNHLEGREVYASCPGVEPLGPFTVVGGSVTIPAGWGPYSAYGTSPVAPFAPGAFKAAIGLPYVCDLELLDARPGSSNQKTVVAVGFEIDQSSGIAVGQDFEHLVDWENRTPEDQYEFPSAASAYAVVNVLGTWRRTGRAVLRQTLPLPVTVLGITRDLNEGGR